MKSGIYKFTNTINNKVYIGSSNNIDRRIYEHSKKCYRAKDNKSRLLFKALLKYGKENFLFQILEKVDISLFTSKSQISHYLHNREQVYLDQYFAQEYISSNKTDKRFRNLTYNINPLAGKPYIVGMKHSKNVCYNRKKWWKDHPMSLEDRKLRGLKALGNKSRTGQTNSKLSMEKNKLTKIMKGKIKLIKVIDSEGRIQGLYAGYAECSRNIGCAPVNVRKSFINNWLCKGYKLEQCEDHN